MNFFTQEDSHNSSDLPNWSAKHGLKVNTQCFNDAAKSKEDILIKKEKDWLETQQDKSAGKRTHTSF